MECKSAKVMSNSLESDSNLTLLTDPHPEKQSLSNFSLPSPPRIQNTSSSKSTQNRPIRLQPLESPISPLNEHGRTLGRLRSQSHVKNGYHTIASFGILYHTQHVSGTDEKSEPCSNVTVQSPSQA
jgi:hypothetical protein